MEIVNSPWPNPALPSLQSQAYPLRLKSASGSLEIPVGSTQRMYVCGITPYDATHLGHAATYLTFDLINRYVLLGGGRVDFVENITDIDEPLLERAQRDDVDWQSLAQKETDLFTSDMTALRILAPEWFVPATQTMDLVDQAITAMQERGYVYEVEGDLYFRTVSFLWELPFTQEECLAIFSQRGGDPDRPGKENPFDPVLWIANRNNEPGWQSSHGFGRPGWHIECSAMATKYLGPEFDIHGGGMDLQFPHHESEIAQSTICNHHAPAKYWIHNNMITINGKKMGKSYNNVIKLTEIFSGNHPLLSQAFTPITVRFFILQSHYRSPVDFSSEALQASEKALKRLWEAYEVLKKLQVGTTEKGTDVALETKVLQWINEFDKFMDDDFSTAKILANMFELTPVINGIKDGHIAANAISSSTLSLLQQQFKIYLEDIFGLAQTTSRDDGALQGVVQLLIDIRKESKAKKDYATSDKIRNQLTTLGIELKDEKDGGMSWNR